MTETKKEQDNLTQRIITGSQTFIGKTSGGSFTKIAAEKFLIDVLDVDITAAIFLDAVIFWSYHKHKTGWFYMSYDEWFERYRLTQRQVTRAYKKVNTIFPEILNKKVKRANGKVCVYYYLDWDLFFYYLSFYQESKGCIDFVQKLQNVILPDWFDRVKQQNVILPPDQNDKMSLSINVDTIKDYTNVCASGAQKPETPSQKTPKNKPSGVKGRSNGKSAREKKAKVSQTYPDPELRWLRHELRPLGLAFLKYAGQQFNPVDKKEVSLWYEQLGKWQKTGATEEDIRKTIEHMRRERLAIKSPVSITGMLRDHMAKQTVKTGQQYTVFKADNESMLYDSE